MSQPALVSIILTAQIPTWFEAALISALKQDYDHCEILVADSSGDKFIPAILTPYLNQPGHSVRHLIYDKEDEGIYEAVIQEAQGEYIKFLTDAELLEAHCVSTLLAALEAHPNCSVAASKRTRIDPKGVTVPDIVATSAFLAMPAILKGQDFLRYQATLHFSMIGELTASLLRRKHLLELVAKTDSLFEINGEKLKEVNSLIIYCQLLTQGDLVWFPTALCKIRVSEVYIQPQSREGQPHVIKNRETVFDTLRRAAWYVADTSPINMVRVAPLSDPENFTRENLSATQYHHLNQGAFQFWLDERKLKPFQQEYLDKLDRQDPQVTQLAVVITVTKQNCALLPLTLASLIPQGSAQLQVKAILVGEVIDNIDGVVSYPATEENRLQVINGLINDHQDNWFLFIEAGNQFQSSGLIALSTTLPQVDGVLAIYADEFFTIDGEPTGIAFRPDFNLDLLLSSPKTMAQHWLFRRELLLAADGFDVNYPASAEFDLIIKMIESQGTHVVGHLAEPLLLVNLVNRAFTEDAEIIERHLNNRGYPTAKIALDSFYNYRLRYEHPSQPKVSIAILANWHLPSLISCVTSILEKTRYHNYELLIVADNEHTPERENWLKSIATVDPQNIRVLQFNSAYQHAGMANLAAGQAKGDYLAFMHCELAVTDGEWLDNLLNHGQRPEVAIVGGKQLTSQNKIRHAGYLLGTNGAAGEAFRGQDDNAPSYLGRLHLDQNYSAVSGDFMLVRKAVFEALKGFDPGHLLFDDVDFCLRARAEGYLTVWTPYSRILRPAARSNPFAGENVHSSGKLKQLEEDKLYSRWMPVIANDPAHNANLSLKSRNFDVNSDSSLSWRPAQRANLPVFMAHNADVAGCGFYRVITPFEAMQNEGIAEGRVSSTLLSLSEIGQIKPDSLIIQRRYAPAFHNWIERTGKVHDVFKVYELDDYILNVPIKHYRRSNFKQEITAQLRKSLSYFDRFVVSTEPLAEALGDMHTEIVVVPNKLPVSWWGNLKSLRNQGRKPRVGWAGGASHTGDLEMIVDVVKEFANEVEWVFFGMCPMKLRPYVHEIHHGVDISLYPEKLASLNLDLALAPVEDNLFNRCKSNLRLMEYGSCGIPVICSDVECYRGHSMPVTRVSNRFIDWRDAIRMHLADPDASARMGAELQQIVYRDWMLTGDNVKAWAKAWSAN